MSTMEEQRVMEMRFPAQTGRMNPVRKSVRDALADCGLDELAVEEIVLAISEACQNVIRHGYADGEAGDIVLSISRTGETLSIRITDFAPTFDPAQVQPRDLSDIRPGGLGVHFITELMDTAECMPGSGGVGNVLLMTKKTGVSP